MPICPVCRSQNMETAKFCGNCGNPFPRTNESTSSLIKCDQGHIYSAVYATCPYCPQPSSSASTVDFETRIEESVNFAPPLLNVPPPPQPPGEFATRIESPAYTGPELVTRVDTPIPSAFATRVESPAYAPAPGEFITRIDSPAAPTHDFSRGIETVEAQYDSIPLSPAPPAAAAQMPRTELISEPLRFEARPPGPEPEPILPLPPELLPAEPFAPQAAAPAPSLAPPPAPPRVEPVKAGAPAPSFNAQSPTQSGRHTSILSAEEAKRVAGSKGKLIGWLVTYAQNPDGEDFKVRAGYNRIGANPACDIVVDDETVSGSHAIIVYREGRCLIKDDLSRNGTFVNGKEITEAHPLQSYDQVRVGNTTLTFVAAQK